MSTSQRNRRKSQAKGKGSVEKRITPAPKPTANSVTSTPTLTANRVTPAPKPTVNSDAKRPNQRQRRRVAPSRKPLLFGAIISLVVAIMVAVGVVWFTTHENTGDGNYFGGSYIQQFKPTACCRDHYLSTDSTCGWKP